MCGGGFVLDICVGGRRWVVVPPWPPSVLLLLLLCVLLLRVLLHVLHVLRVLSEAAVPFCWLVGWLQGR